MTQDTPSPFDAAERALLRHEFFPRFGQAPSLADGIWLRTWRSGAKAGQSKIPAAAASMLARGLLEQRPAAGPGGTRAYFTEAGYAAPEHFPSLLNRLIVIGRSGSVEPHYASSLESPAGAGSNPSSWRTWAYCLGLSARRSWASKRSAA